MATRKQSRAIAKSQRKKAKANREKNARKRAMKEKTPGQKLHETMHGHTA